MFYSNEIIFLIAIKCLVINLCYACRFLVFMWPRSQDSEADVIIMITIIKISAFFFYLKLRNNVVKKNKKITTILTYRWILLTNIVATVNFVTKSSIWWENIKKIITLLEIVFSHLFLKRVSGHNFFNEGKKQPYWHRLSMMQTDPTVTS